MPMGLICEPQYLKTHSARHVMSTVGKRIHTDGNIDRTEGIFIYSIVSF